MKNLVFVLYMLMMISCKEEPFIDDHCTSPVLEQLGVSKEDYFQSIQNLPTDHFTKSDMDYFRGITYATPILGGVNIDSANKCYYLNISQWFDVFNNDPGGAACGGISMFSYRILDSVTTVPVATISIRVKDFSANIEGHVITLVGVMQDDSLVYSEQDFMFNTTIVWRNNPDKLVDVRDVIRMAYEGTLAQQTKFTNNTTSGYYLQDSYCLWDENTYYIPSEVEEVYHSGRELNPYIVKAPRTFERYSKLFSWHGRNFSQTYNDIVESYGWGPFDFENHPEDLVYIYAAVFGFIIADNGFPIEKFQMFGLYNLDNSTHPPKYIFEKF
jgi:hypothetical protein